MEYRVIRSDDELYHHGVKGMKWGVRKRQKLIDNKRAVIKQNIETNDRYTKRLKADMDDVRKNGSNSQYVKSRAEKILAKNPNVKPSDIKDLEKHTYKELKDQYDFQIRYGKRYVEALNRLDKLDASKCSKSDIKRAVRWF